MPHKAVLVPPLGGNSCLFSLHMNRSKDLRTEKLKGEFFSPARGRGRALRQNLNSFKINWTQFKLCFNKFRSSLGFLADFLLFFTNTIPSVFATPSYDSLPPPFLQICSSPSHWGSCSPETRDQYRDSEQAIIIIQNVLTTTVSKP